MNLYYHQINWKEINVINLIEKQIRQPKAGYRRIHHVKFLAFHGNQLEYIGSQGANGGG